MKLLTFDDGHGPRLGGLAGDQVVDLAQVSQGELPGNMRDFLTLGDTAWARARSLVTQARTDELTIDIDQVKVLAPILNPRKIVAIGLNYMDHCREQDKEPPPAPIIFAKFSTAIIGPDEAIRWDPALTSQVDLEAELAVIIGRTARRVSQADALNYVAGYTICNDVSARDLQFSDRQYVRGKSLDTFCPLGPYLVSRNEIPDPHHLAIRSLINDQVMQDSSTSELIFNIPFLIEYISRAFTLLPGDIITTGTPDGVGVFRSPPVFLKDGDQVTVEIEGVGRLSNFCVEER
jgi:2-keto-4-pentenoate hydratase/2-oxohepta-3-ene-1,7-dioic acid hydratase in catechol pathway